MNQNIKKELSEHLAKKTVRFAPPKQQQQPNLKINQTILTNTYQVGELCKKCGALRIGPQTELGCKNCLIPKPKGNTNLNKSEFLSRSKENLNKLNDKKITIENPAKIPEILDKIKPDDLNTLNENTLKKIKNIESQICPAPVKPRKNIMTKSSWTCFSCKKFLNPGEAAIIAEHVDPNARWHPECFSCCICQKLLTDLLYYNRGNDIYCENHFFENDDSKICGACNLSIKSKEYVAAENNFWHLEHFVCWDCETSLADQKYVVVESKPFCFICHQKKYAKICQTCKNEISPDEVRFTYEKLNWHSNSKCFKCHCCNKDLIEHPFMLKKNLLFCSLDCKKNFIKN